MMENKLSNKKNAQKIFLGVILVLFGLVLIAARTIESGVFVLLLPGVSMLIWGCLSKEVGWIIPGSIVSSIGVASYFIEETKIGAAQESVLGGTFMLIFAAGFFMITLLTRIFTGKAHFWALIPGSIIALFGGLLLMGEKGNYLLEMSNYLWAGALVIVGLIILLNTLRKK